MKDNEFQNVSAAIRHRVRMWQFIVFGGTLAAITTVNAFTDLSDAVRDGRSLSPWQPFVWEYSSALLIWLLIPGIAWLNNRILITGRSWKWTVPLHILGTIPYSLIHVTGMVALRKLVYVAADLHYDSVHRSWMRVISRACTAAISSTWTASGKSSPGTAVITGYCSRTAAS